jgi:hypothetical protein
MQNMQKQVAANITNYLPTGTYQLKQGFLDNYMRHELRQPALAFA